MPLVVFLRGVNVGGHKAFQPSALARDLADFDVVNLGAAGTFVVRKKVSQAALRAALLEKLPVQAEIMICRARDVLRLADTEPFGDITSGAGVARYVSVLAKRAAAPPSLPIARPEGADWQVKVVTVAGRFVLSLHRRQGRRLIYPNEVVEKSFGMSATTRNWNTILAIGAALQGD
ncbi:MAG: DUF1697 domain-containing protein [Gemmataceae bacterium]